MKSPKDMRIIQIELTNACVHSCSNCTRFCGHHTKPFFMDFETFKKAVNSLEGYVGTIGIMGGEPTLHPEFERFVEYLDNCLPDENRKKTNRFIYPQKDFMSAMKAQEWENTIPYDYSTGRRETVCGAGLWSAMVKPYKNHYEIIQDVFKYQAVNDHGSIMYHQPILITRKELGIGDAEWKNMRDNCWVQQIWSASITPKGAFFCEIAAALDMLFDGPGGWPIEPGWWKREEKDFGDQLKWCELCGIAAKTFTRDANEGIDDVSPVLYEKLKSIDSPKVNKGNVNILKIENGLISDESKKSAKEFRGFIYYDTLESRFNSGKSILYSDSFIGVMDCDEKTDTTDIIKVATNNINVLNHLTILCKSKLLYDNLKSSFNNMEKIDLINCEDNHFGIAFNNILKRCDPDSFIVVFSENIRLSNDFEHILKEYILNPGTLHYIDFSEVSGRNLNLALTGSELVNGYMAIMNKKARSLRKIGQDGILNSNSFRAIVDNWEASKVVDLSVAMGYQAPTNRLEDGLKYILYGAGAQGERVVQKIRNSTAQLVGVVDSNPDKWGCDYKGMTIMNPQFLVDNRQKYNKIVISSMWYYSEIKKNLELLGLPENMYCLI